MCVEDIMGTWGDNREEVKGGILFEEYNDWESNWCQDGVSTCVYILGRG